MCGTEDVMRDRGCDGAVTWRSGAAEPEPLGSCGLPFPAAAAAMMAIRTISPSPLKTRCLRNASPLDPEQANRTKDCGPRAIRPTRQGRLRRCRWTVGADSSRRAVGTRSPRASPPTACRPGSKTATLLGHGSLLGPIGPAPRDGCSGGTASQSRRSAISADREAGLDLHARRAAGDARVRRRSVAALIVSAPRAEDSRKRLAWPRSPGAQSMWNVNILSASMRAYNEPESRKLSHSGPYRGM